MRLNLLDLLLPRETKFFDYLNQQTEIFLEASELFRKLVTRVEPENELKIKKYIDSIKECEKKGDEIESQTILELNQTFITPIDREDIHSLTVNLDRSLDILDNLAQKFDIYQVKTLPPNTIKFADLIVEIAKELKKLMTALKQRENVLSLSERIHNIENKGDYLVHLSLAELFEKDFSPIDVIKFKEIYEQMESVIDSVDFVGKLVRGIQIKLG